MPMNAIETYKTAWDIYKKNWKMLAISGFLTFFLSVLIAVPLLATIVAMYFIAMPAAQMNPLLPPLAIAGYFLLVGLTVMAGGIVKGALFGVCYEARQEEKLEWGRVFHWMKVRWKTFAGIALVQLVVILLLQLPFTITGSLIAGATGIELAGVAMSLLAIPFLVLVANILTFAIPKTVAEFTGTRESVSGGIKTALARPFQFLLLLVVMLFASLIGLIPFVGMLVVDPLNTTAFVVFYMEGKKQARRKR